MTDQDRKTATSIVAKFMMVESYTGARLVDEIAAALAAARGRWIPVGESRAPVAYERVPIYNMESGYLSTGYIREDGTWRDCEANILPVTHWLDVPEPPQEGGSNG